MQHARTTLTKIFAQTLRREGGEQAPILAWPLACGSKVAARTTAVSFAAGVLAVEVPDTAWRCQLQILSQHYLAALNQIRLQKVRDIKFVLPSQRSRSAN